MPMSGCSERMTEGNCTTVDVDLVGSNTQFALAIRGLAVAGRALARDDLVKAAVEAITFIREQLFVDGKMMIEARWPNMRFEDLWERSCWASSETSALSGRA